jgi:hypothetical protein
MEQDSKKFDVSIGDYIYNSKGEYCNLLTITQNKKEQRTYFFTNIEIFQTIGEPVYYKHNDHFHYIGKIYKLDSETMTAVALFDLDNTKLPTIPNYTSQ